MKDKNVILILLVLVSFGVIYGIYMPRLRSAPTQEVSGQNELYNQTAIPTIFAPTQSPPIVILNSAYANSNLLRLNFTISKLELVANADDLENVICNPYINPDEPVSLTFNYREAEIPSLAGEPILLTYEYNMDAKEYKSLTLALDLVIGPCADYLNAQEINVTTSPLSDLIASYHLSFQVQVQ